MFLFFIGFTSTTVLAQHRLKSSEVPQEVLKSFNSKYTEYKKVVWRKVGVLYEADIFHGKKLCFATYEANGTWVETLTEIKVSDIPAEVIAGVKSIYSSAIIKAGAKIEQASNENLYIVQFKFKGKRGEVTLDEKGK